MRRDVVQDGEDDEKEPSKQHGDSLADEAPVGVERVVDQARTELLPEAGVGLGYPQHSGRRNRFPRSRRENRFVVVNRGHKMTWRSTSLRLRGESAASKSEPFIDG